MKRTTDHNGRSYVQFGSKARAVITLIAIIVALVTTVGGCGPIDPPESYLSQHARPG